MDFKDFDFNDFRVVVQGIRAISNAEVRIYPTKIDFSAMAAAEMGYPKFVRIFISNDAVRMAIEPCSKDSTHAIPFYKEQYSKKTGKVRKNAPISVRDTGFAKGIRQKLEWTKGTYHCSAIRFDERPNTLFFDLSTADNTKKKRVKITNVLDTYPPISSLLEGMRPIALLPASTVIPQKNKIKRSPESTYQNAIEVPFVEQQY